MKISLRCMRDPRARARVELLCRFEARWRRLFALLRQCELRISDWDFDRGGHHSRVQRASRNWKSTRRAQHR